MEIEEVRQRLNDVNVEVLQLREVLKNKEFDAVRLQGFIEGYEQGLKKSQEVK